MLDINQFVSLRESISNIEQSVLNAHDVEFRLREIAKSKFGVKIFATEFFPVRYSFVHANFLLGARREMCEELWSGLARNLYEEAGASTGISHNFLYQRFMNSAGVPQDALISERGFSKAFNSEWRSYVQNAPVEEAVLAVAIYEVLDNPDYSMFVRAFSGINAAWDLEFFELHSRLSHFELFYDFLSWLQCQNFDVERLTKRASDFVLNTQEAMWVGLLKECELKLLKLQLDSA